MRTKWISALLVIGTATSCTADLERKEKATRAKNAALQRQLEASEESRKKAEAQAGSLQSTLNATDQELAEKKAQAAQLTAALATLTQSLSAKEQEVSTLTANLAAKEKELARLTALAADSGVSTEELKAQLEAAEKARDQATQDLKMARDEAKRLRKSLEDQKTRSLQAFLENAGPETLFAADASDLAGVFKLDGRECAVVMDIAKELEVVRGPQREELPRLGGYDVLPMRVAYKKVLVCKEGTQLRLSQEEGYLYRLISDANMEERKLVSGRKKGSCDAKPADILKASVFGELPFQVLNPFRGSIDGIETIDLPRAENGSLRLHMGSAVVGAPSCAKAAALGEDEALPALACKVALGQSVAGLSLVEGCYTEKKDGDVVSLIFNM